MSDVLKYGKLPPQAVELEEAVLGALILEADAIMKIDSIVAAESFYKDEHQDIYTCVKSMFDSGKDIDLQMVTRELKNIGILEKVGGPFYITKLISKVANASNIESHARIIAQNHIARQVIRIASEYQNKAFDTSIDIDSVIGGLQDDLSMLLENGVQKEATFSLALANIRERIIENRRNPGNSGLKTGYSRFDHFTGGLQMTDLVVIAGETSQGKTSLALSIIANVIALNEKAKAAIFSLEMSKEQLAARIISSKTGISSKEMLSKSLSDEELANYDSIANQLTSFPIWFDERSRQDIESVCSSLRRMKMKHDVNIAVVDFIQLIDSGQKGNNDESKIAFIIRKLKNIAKELDINVIALSQLSRDKNNPVPTKNRLRGSGQIEEAADIILLVWRPEEYGISTFPNSPFEGKDTAGFAEVEIAKGRNVGTGSFLLKFNKNTTAFYDYDPRFEDQVSRYNPNSTIEPEKGDDLPF